MEEQIALITQSASPINATSSAGYVYDGPRPTNVLVQPIEFHTVPLPVLLDFLFPFLERGYVANVVDDLTRKGMITQRGWQSFLGAPLGDSNTYGAEELIEGEINILKPLETIFEQVALSVRPNDLPLVRLSVHGPQNVPGTLPGNRARLYGSIHLRDTGTGFIYGGELIPYDDSHICLYIHGKKNDDDEHPKHTEQALLWDIHHKFQSDPRCRFLSGMTIENTTARFWYFDRANAMRSDAFDFMQEPHKLVHTLLGYVLAPNEASLGFDTSMRSMALGEEIGEVSYFYEIGVGTSTGDMIKFHTTACLTDFCAMDICGRGTRIWEVSKVGDEDEGRLYFMKDIWIDRDRPTEGDWLRVIHTEGQTEDLQYFPKPAFDGPVLIQNWRGEYCQDDTLNIQMGPNSQAEYADDEALSEWRYRKHYRIVFSEAAGIPIQMLTTYGEAFKALHGALKALQAMLRINLTHGNVTPSNIFLMDRGTQYAGIILGMEDAKKFPHDTQAGHAVQTGARPFMALEVLEMDYIFQNRSYHARASIPWAHNPIHDVESTWWIALWIFYSLPGVKLSKEERGLRYKLFTTADYNERVKAFNRKRARSKQPHKIPISTNFLEDWRVAIITFYEEQQADLQNGSHERFDYHKVLTDAIARVEAIQQALVDSGHNGSPAVPPIPEEADHGEENP